MDDVYSPHRRQARQIWIATALVLAVLWAAIAAFCWADRRQQLTEARESTAQLARVLAEQTDRAIADADRVIQFARWQHQVDPNGDTFGRAREIGLVNDAYTQMVIVDAAGTAIRLLNPAVGDRMPNFVDRDWWQATQAQTTDAPFIGRPTVGRVRGRWTINIARPILVDGVPRGAVIVAMDPFWFARFFDSIKLGPHGSAQIYDATGQILSRSNLDARMLSGEVRSPRLGRDLSDVPEAFYDVTSSIDGQDKLLSTKRLAHFALGVSVAYGRDDVLQPVNGRALALAVAGLLATLLCLYAASRFAAAARQQASLGAALASETEQLRRAEAERKDAMQLLEQAFAASRDGIWINDLRPGGFGVSVTPRWKAQLGYADDQLGDSIDAWTQVIHPDDSAGCFAAYAAFIDGNEPSMERVDRFLHADGGIRWILSRVIRARAEDGGTARLVGVHTDITEVKLAEERIRDIIESMEDALLVWGPDGRLVLSNARYRELFDPIGEMLVPGTHWADWRDTVIQSGLMQRPADNGEDWWLLPAAERPPINIELLLSNGRWLLCRDHATSDGGAIGLRTDITALKSREIELSESHGLLQAQSNELSHLVREIERAKWQVDRAYEARGLMLTHISHELRTPMTAVIGFASLIEAQALGPIGNGEYVEFARRIISNGEHQISIISDVLDLARADAGRLVLELEPLEFRDIAEWTLEQMGPIAATTGTALRLEMDPSLPLTADEKRMRQVLMNLLGNAIKFTPNGLVTMDARRGDDGVLVVRIVDTGRGIDPEQIADVMELFGQANDPGNKGRGGTGIGLPLVRRLVEAHGGSFRLESKGIGTGTTATVRIPPAGHGTRGDDTEEADGPPRVTAFDRRGLDRRAG